MLNLTRKTDYALIAMGTLAAQSPKVLSARLIADQYEVPLPLLMNVLKRLSASGLLQSVRGSRGGYRLNRPAEQINVAEIIESLEGPIRLSACSCAPGEDPARCAGDCGCRLAGKCPIRSSLQTLHQQIRGVLTGMTVADLARQRRDDNAGTAIQA